MAKIKWVKNQLPKSEDRNLSIMALGEVEKAKSFHESFPEYSRTPLAKLDEMANYLKVKNIYVKDESFRFGLNAFKVLGGAFAIAKYIGRKTGRDIWELGYPALTSDAMKREFGQATFFTATDGNHGRGVAWAATRLGQKSVVYMPKGSTHARLENIRAEGALVTIQEGNYDECVRMAAAAAAKTPNGVVIQDTAWEGYEEIPSWIIQGYGTMALEADEQLNETGCDCPTHILIQAGVGSLAGAIQGYFVNRFPENPPKVLVVEASAADCLYQSALAGDGKERTVNGNLQTIMAGLACGEANPISWDILKNHAFAFVSAPDWVAAKGMRMLSAPIKGDPRIVSGESGAAPFGVLACIMTMPEYKDLKEELELNENSRVLLFSTEGDTDPHRYREIIWNGRFREDD